MKRAMTTTGLTLMAALLLASPLISSAYSADYKAPHNAQDIGDINPAEVTMVYAGHVLSVPGQSPKRNQTILIHDGKILGVEAGFLTDNEAVIIDLRDKFILPGLIDSHVHLRAEWSPTSRLDSVAKRDSDIAFDAALNARKNLEAGFTALQDVGGPESVFALRDAINAGKIPGPHIRASGSAVSVTGGHGDFHGFHPKVLHAFQPPTICDGPAACRRATRQAVKNGADLIKITATGGVLSNTAAGTGQQFFEDELKAIVDSATTMGRKVTAHAHGKKGIEAALKAGVKSIEHGTYLDDETIALFKKHDATLVPTVLAGMTVVDWATNHDFLPPASAKKALIVGPLMLDMLRRAWEGGVNVAFGTDTGVSRHGENAREFGFMIAAGMSEMDAIKAATVTASKHIGMGNEIGTLEVGKFADLIAVDASPLENIEELYDVDFVMKGGVVYKDK